MTTAIRVPIAAEDRRTTVGAVTTSLEYTQVADPASATATGDAATGWAEVATVTYVQLEDIQPGDGLTPYLRHEFDVSLNGEAILASGIRLSGLAGGTAIDELEVYVVPEPSSWCGAILGLAMAWLASSAVLGTR